MGLRWAAIPLVLTWDSIWRQRGWRIGGLAVATLALPLLALSALAADSMRSVGIALPWILYGTFELVRRPEGARWLVGLALLQLVTPAAQVTAGAILQIDSLPLELYRLERGPSPASPIAVRP